MNLSGKGLSGGDNKLTAAKAALNPNAVEFVPFALRSPSAAISNVDMSSKFAISGSSIPGKSIIDRSEPSIPNNSDEESQQYWQNQLPDDITPDFKIMNADDSQGVDSLPFSSLGLTDFNDSPRYNSTAGSVFALKGQQQGLSPRLLNGNGYADKLSYPISSYGEYPSPTSFQSSPAKPWDKQIIGNDQLHFGEGHGYGNPGGDFLTDVSNEQLSVDNANVNPIEFLASQFPDFAAESLAEVYLANDCDLNLTIGMLTQLELQVEGSFNETLNSNTAPTPNLTSLDFPALSATESIHQNASPYRSSENENTLLYKTSSPFPLRGATDFASAVRKMASQDSSIWKYERNGSSGTNVGPSRSSQVLTSSYNNGGQGRSILADRLRSKGSTRAPVWVETGEAVANMYSDMREEARDHARIRNTYFEQATQAYLIGNKALAKELSLKGQRHNMQMKAAHGKAQESIYRQRNQETHVNSRERMIDLHGLHVTEAIHVLKHELAVLKHAARSTDQRMLAYICVGTGHHTRGSRTPARLPIAVQRFLLEEEGLDYSEPQAGLLRVVVY